MKLVHRGGSSSEDGAILGAAWAWRPSQAGASLAQSLVDAAVEACRVGRVSRSHKTSLAASKSEAALRKRLVADHLQSGSDVLVVSGSRAVSVYSADDWACLKSWSSPAEGRSLSQAAVVVPGTSTIVAVDERDNVVMWDYFQEGLQLPCEDTENASSGQNKRGSRKGAGQKRRVVRLATSPSLVGLFVTVYSDGELILRCKDAELAVSPAPKDRPELLQATVVPTGGSFWAVVCTEIVQEAVEEDGEEDTKSNGKTKGRAGKVATKSVLRVRVVDLHPHGFGQTHVQVLETGERVPEDVLAVLPSTSSRVTVVWKDGACASANITRSAYAEVALSVPTKVPGGDVACCDAVTSAESSIALVASGKRLVAWDACLGVELGGTSYKSNVNYVSFLSLEGQAAVNASNANAGSSTDDDQAAMVAVVLENSDVYVDLMGSAATASDAPFAAALRPSRLIDAVERRKLRKRPRAESINNSKNSNVTMLHGDLTQLLESAEPVDSASWTKALTAIGAEDANESSSRKTPASKKSRRKTQGENGDISNDLSKLEAQPEVADLSVEFVRVKVASLVAAKDWSKLEEVIRNGTVSVSTNPEVIPALIKANNVMLLYLCIMYVSDLGEGDMVSILRFVLTECEASALADFTERIKQVIESEAAEDSAAKKKGSKGAVLNLKGLSKYKKQAELRRLANKEVQIAERRARYQRITEFFKFLSPEQLGVQFVTMAAMCNIRNEVFFVRAARSLPQSCLLSLFEGAASLLVYFENMPLNAKDYLFNPHGYKGRHAILIPNVSFLLVWLCALLDAGLPVMIKNTAASEKVRKSVERIATISKHNATLCERLNAVRQPLRFCLKMNKDVNPSSTIGDYVVETVEF
mmetsp:Transcript_12975/g.25160  ORF Transcript_12975/g.25160 Transcript_12975/m.25160 type:complete len:870 (-) Transcript_12975:305-2914(-)|eukprot:CAMPEP_0171555434 /NCGR_PEP_ID=MMETSP0960-20121227/10149_1 /TAXON_ID=87120 /ORGANISM="Aurantiochytrium limacinum, Strain ATCCMYA-1381" /LENGTH=869 /DNA_ID=CAMNT_0012105543 /DNA_START=255 /DNA_END=2864 /DNA_ORIENTATION=+